jgi:hypothetical protein
VGSIPRLSGRFYWQQISTAINAGATMLYVALFDEVNEGTAIFKCCDNPPVSDVAKFSILILIEPFSIQLIIITFLNHFKNQISL